MRLYAAQVVPLWEKVAWTKSAPDEGFASAERCPSPGFALRSHTLPQGERAGCRPSRLHRDRREVHEPALRLHKALDLRAHGARRDVVGDIEERRVIDGGRVQFGEHRI